MTHRDTASPRTARGFAQRGQVAVLTIALVDGVGIPLALGDPAITPDGAVADVLTALGDLLHAPAS